MLGLAALETESGQVTELLAGERSNAARRAISEAEKVDPLSEGVYFHEGNLGKGNCNTGWVVFDDYVLVIDASFPSNAKQVVAKIRAITDKPIRFAFDTHHHGDHAYGNEVMVESGATAVAHTGVLEEMKRYETGYFDNKPGRWEGTAKMRVDLRSTHLKPPSVLFPREMIFDDGKRRVELIHLGVAHTHGDAVAWLPKERILFTGDVCVNGPYNFVGDGNVEQWVGTLEGARKLGTRIVCPGHGVRGEAGMLDAQQLFFKELREKVGALVNAHKSPAEIHASLNEVRAQLTASPGVAHYVSKDTLDGQVEKVLQEMTGQGFPDENKTSGSARLLHREQHGLDWLG